MSELPSEIGKKGENIAVEFLVQNGYSILEQNWRFKHLEIDIIAEKGDFLVIVEVKYRAYTTYGEPEVFVNKQKQKFLIEATNHYIQQKNINKEVRFDIIAISRKNGQLSIHHIQDAFYAR
ncbi:MAG: YraN family protein [Bacteroidota bacterium]